MWYSITESLLSFSILEWIGLITGIVYVVLSAQNKIICWYFGIISCACIAYHDFFGGIKLYSDGVLQIIYIIFGIIGLYNWRKKKISDDTRVLIPQYRNLHLIALTGGSLLSLGYGYLMGSMTDTAFPFIDAFTTVFSIIATVLLVDRKLSAWIYFIIIDAIMTILYFVRGWELYALLFLIYTVVAVYAVWKWRKIKEESKVVI